MILACLLILLIGLVIFIAWRETRDRRFIDSLTEHLLGQGEQPGPVHLTAIPPKFSPLYHALESLLTLTSSLGKDKLTGLDNRLGIKRQLAASMPLTSGTLVLLDVYRFRYVNDLFGFTLGDELLKQLAGRIRHLTRPDTLIARMNEDEFLIYFDMPITQSQLVAFIEQLQVPFDTFGTPITTRIQMGYLELEKYHSDISSMLRRLDLAMKKAKQGESMLAAYAMDDDRVQLREVTIINSLAKALNDGDLHMVYQPKQDIPSQECTQVEALMRWEHKELGTISPAEFIPLAEYSGMTDMVSRWVLDEVFAQQAKWLEMDLRVQVAVNLSTQDLNSESLTEEIAARLSQYALDAGAISIEITESKLMADIDSAVIAINKLRDLGVDLAIDDFGTGHSSLAYLKYLPVDEVKIDKAFLVGLEDDAQAMHIMRTSIALAKGLGFKVTVEGVETREVKALLGTMGVDKIQGDIFAKPMTPTELEANWPRLRGPA